jgi:hypothetical protein
MAPNNVILFAFLIMITFFNSEAKLEEGYFSYIARG